MRTLSNLATHDLGFRPDRLLMVMVDPPGRGLPGAATDELLRETPPDLLGIPGVRHVTLSSSGPFHGDGVDRISLDGSPVRDPARLRSHWTLVGPDYFRAVGIPLLRGREIGATDAAIGLQVCVGAVSLLLHTTGEPSGLMHAVRESLRQADNSLPVLIARTVRERVDRELITERLLARLAAFFGVVALLMAALGLYGVIAYSIGKRRSEIGIRMALGASRRRVARMVLVETIALVGFGMGIGVPVALALAAAIASRLYGVAPADPLTLSCAGLAILAAALVSGYVPARYASRIDPMRALRSE